MSSQSQILLSSLPVVSDRQALLLKEELGVTTTDELLQNYPSRYEDRSTFIKIKDAIAKGEKSDVQIIGKIISFNLVRSRQSRLHAIFSDETGTIELVWFKGISIITRIYKQDTLYILYGKISKYGRNYNIAHPELEEYRSKKQLSGKLTAIYPLTEKLRKNNLNSRKIGSIVKYILNKSLWHITEDLPEYMIKDLSLLDMKTSISQIHIPSNADDIEKCRYRLKFSELLYNQLQIIRLGLSTKTDHKGFVFKSTKYVHKFHDEVLQYELTKAQKKVIKEIYNDMKSGCQMNRLLQGDVGSGKTVVAFISMLIAISNGKQVTLMAPTEVLAQQHYQGLLKYTDELGLSIGILTGSVKSKVRKDLHSRLSSGSLNILVGTHALLEGSVSYHSLGLAVIDEQHRFGVAQRSKLWQKTVGVYPHILVMTATPIPRTLAMTVYGNLDVSIIDELPADRLPIITSWRFERDRLSVFGVVNRELTKGRQAYFVFPLIEESEKLDLLFLEQGYDNIRKAFADVPVSIVHGRQSPDAKAIEMRRFVNGETRIMVATTVIEVGVDVPNASIMVIENAERFGLSQLHQLRGRVGRDNYQSYCILMAGEKISSDSKERLKTMVATTDGFKIAKKDMELRGPGNIAGTQQSGLVQFKIADIIDDEKILVLARRVARYLLREDPNLVDERHSCIRHHFGLLSSIGKIDWSKIS